MSEMTKKMEDAGFVSVTSAARAAGVSVYTIYRWVEQGKIAGAKVGARHFVEKKSLAEYVIPTWLGQAEIK